jgi:uncharacterized damage-inducible protein DinB
MNKETQSIIRNLENTLNGQPWYGRAVYEILKEVKEADAYKKPGGRGHSLIELLYHMLTWVQFTHSRLEKEDKTTADFEELDWRTIDPSTHNWQKGLRELKDTHDRIVAILQTKTDDFLKEMVDDRQYNFRFLLNGLIQHNIYHLGQIAYISKFAI